MRPCAKKKNFIWIFLFLVHHFISRFDLLNSISFIFKNDVYDTSHTSWNIVLIICYEMYYVTLWGKYSFLIGWWVQVNGFCAGAPPFNLAVRCCELLIRNGLKKEKPAEPIWTKWPLHKCECSDMKWSPEAPPPSLCLRLVIAPFPRLSFPSR